MTTGDQTLQQAPQPSHPFVNDIGRTESALAPIERHQSHHDVAMNGSRTTMCATSSLASTRLRVHMRVLKADECDAHARISTRAELECRALDVCTGAYACARAHSEVTQQPQMARCQCRMCKILDTARKPRIREADCDTPLRNISDNTGHKLSTLLTAQCQKREAERSREDRRQAMRGVRLPDSELATRIRNSARLK